LYKGILEGHSSAVFNGKILVRKDAQKTDAKQTNKNLVLSEDAVINTKPELQILADDVRCTHGATIGQLDPEGFFTCSREASVSRMPATCSSSPSRATSWTASKSHRCATSWSGLLLEKLHGTRN
jgi:hypothetical protein